MEKSVISFRVGITQSLPENRFFALLDLFEKYTGITDEITFFTSETHPPIPPDVFEHRMTILAKRMQLAREKGYKAGINVLGTMGHHNENLENSLKGNYTPTTDIDGQVCEGSLCPNDEYLREYVRRIYQSVASANPDFIWLDDDIRLAGHMPIYLTCFCDNCLAIFESEYGLKFTRESFKKTADEGSIEEKLSLRKAWLQHNRNSIAQLLKLIEKAVHEINPITSLGFMTGDRFFEGYDFENWAKILAGPNQIPVRWRPGGGFYQDTNTSELVGKSHDIGRQVSLLPPEVVTIQSEVENFPYQRLKKAAHSVVLEACSHIAAGCTGSAFNVLSMYDEPLDEFEPLLTRLQHARPFIERMTKILGRAPIVGIHTLWNKDSFATSNLREGSWFQDSDILTNHEMYDIGLPACYSARNAPVVLIGKNNFLATSKEEIEEILTGGVYMDGETLQQLNQSGFSKLTGFKVTRSEKMDRIEKFTTHPLNGEFAGRERDNRQSFLGWNYPAYTLEKTDENARALTTLIDYADREIAACSMGIFENNSGGRICVAGYYPWTYLQNLSKSTQLKTVFRWLSKDRLPGYIASFYKINLWIRAPQNGKIALAFTNSSFDPAEAVILMLRTDSKAITVYDMNCNSTVIRSNESDGPYQKFIIPFIDAWQIRLAVTSN